MKGLAFFLALSAWGADLKIQYLANSGVALRCGDDVVLVDALFREGVAGYETLPPELRGELETAAGPWKSVRLVTATHRHRDHFDAQSVSAHLAANPQAVFAGSTQTVQAVQAAGSGRARVLSRGERIRFAGGEAMLVQLPHNAPAGASIENSVVLVTLCGETALFSGDAAVSAPEFAPVAEALKTFAPRGLDHAFLSWWFCTSELGRAVVDGVLHPRLVHAVHIDLDSRTKVVDSVRKPYPAARIATRAAVPRR